jgi:hypothetical protein
MDIASRIQKAKEELRQVTDAEKEAKAQLQELNDLIKQKAEAEGRLAALEKDVEAAVSKL